MTDDRGRAPLDDLAVLLARRVVTETAPQELPLFNATANAYLEDPSAALDRRKQRDEVLGFGIGEVVTFLTPVALAIAGEVVRFLVDEARTVAKGEVGPVVQARLHALLGRKEAPEAPRAPEEAELTPDQLSRMKKIALDTATRLEVPADKASLLADALVGSLVTA